MTRLPRLPRRLLGLWCRLVGHRVVRHITAIEWRAADAWAVGGLQGRATDWYRECSRCKTRLPKYGETPYGALMRLRSTLTWLQVVYGSLAAVLAVGVVLLLWRSL